MRSTWSNKTLQRTGAGRFSFISHWNYNIIGFGGSALPAPVAELDRYASRPTVLLIADHQYNWTLRAAT